MALDKRIHDVEGRSSCASDSFDSPPVDMEAWLDVSVLTKIPQEFFVIKNNLNNLGINFQMNRLNKCSIF